ncbi:hypothetical protein SDC9_168944 [bioreactor metagenome]|uniref:Uncharacterized protein n=1 Tax=bioreactor metagenome TaxID=1076179 RepID=A0A645GC03_9ZZZZ
MTAARSDPTLVLRRSPHAMTVPGELRPRSGDCGFRPGASRIAPHRQATSCRFPHKQRDFLFDWDVRVEFRQEPLRASDESRLIGIDASSVGDHSPHDVLEPVGVPLEVLFLR